MNWLVNFRRSYLSQVSVGNISWLLHRVTGVSLAIYLFPHFISIHSSQLGQQIFDQEMNLYTYPFFKEAGRGRIFELFLDSFLAITFFFGV